MIGKKLLRPIPQAAIDANAQGRGNYSMFFEKYEPVPKSVQEKILSSKND